MPENDELTILLSIQHGADPNKRSSDSSTPLHKLIWINHSETLIPMMSLLIQYGADVNARQENDENALHSKPHLVIYTYI